MRSSKRGLWSLTSARCTSTIIHDRRGGEPRSDAVTFSENPWVDSKSRGWRGGVGEEEEEEEEPDDGRKKGNEEEGGGRGVGQKEEGNEAGGRKE